MITSWRLSQFKSVGLQKTFSLGPLTVFAGANSSGKSSILQSILLVSQTLSSKVSQRQLVLNGELLRLGTFEDVLAIGSSDSEITIGFDVDFDFQNYRLSHSIQRSFRRSPMYLNGIQQGNFSVDLTFVPSRQEGQDGGSKVRTLQSRLLRAKYRAAIEGKGATGRSQIRPKFSQELLIRKRTPTEVQKIIVDINAKTQEGGFADERLLEYEALLEPNDLTSWRRHRTTRSFSVEGRLQLLAAHLDHFLPTTLFYTYPLALRKISGIIEDILEGPRRRVEESLTQMEFAEDEITKAVLSAIKDFAKTAEKSVPEILSSMEFRLATRRVRSLQLEVDEPDSPRIDIFREILTRLSREIKDQRSIDAIELTEPLSALASAVTDSFSTLRYLGPLRDGNRSRPPVAVLTAFRSDPGKP